MRNCSQKTSHLAAGRYQQLEEASSRIPYTRHQGGVNIGNPIILELSDPRFQSPNSRGMLLFQDFVTKHTVAQVTDGGQGGYPREVESSSARSILSVRRHAERGFSCEILKVSGKTLQTI
jgi:hypothetical protein